MKFFEYKMIEDKSPLDRNRADELVILTPDGFDVNTDWELVSVLRESDGSHISYWKRQVEDA